MKKAFSILTLSTLSSLPILTACGGGGGGGGETPADQTTNNTESTINNGSQGSFETSIKAQAVTDATDVFGTWIVTMDDANYSEVERVAETSGEAEDGDGQAAAQRLSARRAARLQGGAGPDSAQADGQGPVFVADGERAAGRWE